MEGRKKGGEKARNEGVREIGRGKGREGERGEQGEMEQTPDRE